MCASGCKKASKLSCKKYDSSYTWVRIGVSNFAQIEKTDEMSTFQSTLCRLFLWISTTVLSWLEILHELIMICFIARQIHTYIARQGTVTADFIDRSRTLLVGTLYISTSSKVLDCCKSYTIMSLGYKGWPEGWILPPGGVGVKLIPQTSVKDPQFF
jgi:hypothetical protein